MSIDSIIPLSEISQTELDMLAAIFSQEVVKKHLRRMATRDIQELLDLSALETDSNIIIRAHSTVQGRLQVVSTLLSIGEIQQGATE